MKTYTRYSESFKEQALAKVYSRGNSQSIQDVADDLNISLQTLKTWMRKSNLDKTHVLPLKSKRPQDWLPEERFTALQKSYSLIGEDLNAWCREQGIFVHQLEKWKADFCRQGLASEKREEARALHTLKAEIHSLERELLRKDKALAEAAALLVLQKKFRALLGGEVE
jgi:transposase-like protein